jgi:hypothetical protein
LRHGKKNTDKVVFHQIKSLMQVQKVSVAKAPDGSVYANVVPGDVVDVQTFKKTQVVLKESSAFS